jgi:hypothetical protein
MAKSTFRQWMYRGHRPNWLARMLGRIDAAFGSSGIGASYGLVTLEVTGRTSGRTISLPVAIAVVDRQRYLVSMLGENVQWVKNVRAAGGKAWIRSHGREEVHLEEVPVDQRSPILKAYLHRAPGGRSHIPVDQDAPLAEFAKIAADYPTRFSRLQPGSHERSRLGKKVPIAPSSPQNRYNRRGPQTHEWRMMSTRHTWRR